MITVKVMQVPGSVKEVALNDGATVGDALAAAEITNSEDYPITVNGASATTSTGLVDGQRVILARSSKSAA